MMRSGRLERLTFLAPAVSSFFSENSLDGGLVSMDCVWQPSVRYATRISETSSSIADPDTSHQRVEHQGLLVL